MSTPPAEAKPAAPLRLLMLGPLLGPPEEPLVGTPGGVNYSFHLLVRELLARDDVEVEVINTFRGEGPLGVSDVALTLATFWRTLLRGLRNDVVSFHASTRATQLFGPLVWLVCRLIRRPYVLREFGGSLDADMREMSSLGRALVGLGLRADLVLLQTRALVEHFRATRPGKRIEWYPTSRPTHEGPPAAERAPGPARRFVFVSHVKLSKGIGELMQAAEALPDECDVEIYGPLREGLTEAFFAGCTHVHYGGVLRPEAVQRTLAERDVLVLPTYHYGEGYPGIVLEAYSVGLPVITTRWRAIPELVEDGKTGLLVEPRDADDLTRALLRVAGDAALLEKLRAGAREMGERFGSARWAGELVRQCRDLTD